MRGILTVWGCRGSYPLIEKNSSYGIQTSCFTLESENALYILDAGSGLRPFLREYEGRSECGKKPVYVFLSHLHHDHVSGLYDCLSLAAVTEEIHIYWPAGGCGTLKAALDRLIGPPYWPLTLSQLCGEKTVFHELAPDMVFTAGELQIRTAAAPHPNGCLWYRLEGNGKPSASQDKRGFVYGLDGELGAQSVPSLLAFAQDASMAVLDAHFSPEELPLRSGWGHASYRECLQFAEQAGIECTLLSHFSPAYSDEELEALEREALELSGQALFVREGIRKEVEI